MKRLLVILRVISVIVFGLGMILLIYFHIEIISMIWRESYAVYCQSPDQILFALQGRLVILVPTAIGAVGWLVTDQKIQKRRVNI